MAKKYTKSEIEGIIKNLKEKEKKARSKWGKAVLDDAQWLLENVLEWNDWEENKEVELTEKYLLNGAENWNQFSWGGSALIYDGDIAEHYSTPSELKKVGFGKTDMGKDVHGKQHFANYVEKQPNANEEWLDVQARALRQAWWAIRDEMNGTTEFSMSLCEFEEKKDKSNFEISDQSITDYVKENCSLSEISEDFLMDVDIEDIESEDDLYQSGVDYIYEHSDIIYYDRAMEFLQKNDPSLREAFDCAEEFCYDVKSLNSELLATLLNTRYNIDDWGKDYQSIWEAIEEYRSNNDDDEGEDKDNMSIQELSAQHDARKSFYGKAQVDVDDKTGVQTLYSYGTKVAQYNPKTKKFTAYPEAKYSATTKRHVREFMKQNGVPASEFSIIDDTKDVLRATGKLAGNIVKNTTGKGGLLMF